MHKTSVVTPSFNQAEYLEKTLDSVLSQGYPHLEYIVIDGGSTDGSVELIKKHQKHLAYWISEPDRGQSHAINKGLKHCTGQVFNWLNSDDFLEPGVLHTIGEAFENPETNVFVGRSNIVENDRVVRQSRGTDVYPDNLPKTLGQARIDQPEHWWRMSVVDGIGPLDENLHYVMDRDWWIKYLLTHGLSGIQKSSVVLANFRLHDRSKTVGSQEAFNHERNAYFQGLIKHYGLANTAVQLPAPGHAPVCPSRLPDSVDRAVLANAIDYFHLLLADEAYVRGDHSEAKRLLNTVDETRLQPADRKFYRKLKSRTILPATLVNLARRLNR